MSNKLTWHEEFGEGDERIFEAQSIFHDDGDHFLFRIRAEQDGTYTEQSDAELISGQPRSWATLDDAKTAIQIDHEKMIGVIGENIEDNADYTGPE